MDLNQLIKDYEILQKKYSLPSFSELNGIFEIEKIDRESKILLRFVRKVMVEKIVNLLGLAELFISPNNVPRMYATYLKSMTSEDKKQITEIYDALSKLIVQSMPLEVEFNEKKEAEMINLMFSTWVKIKPSINSFFGRILNPIQKGNSKEKSYFG